MRSALGDSRVRAANSPIVIQATGPPPGYVGSRLPRRLSGSRLPPGAGSFTWHHRSWPLPQGQGQAGPPRLSGRRKLPARRGASGVEVGENREDAAVVGVGRREAELAEDVADVLFDGSLGDVEAVG